MDRLSHWRAAAWVALCLSGLGAALALLIPPAFRSAPSGKPEVRASLTPRTHLFGQPVTATLQVPAGSSVRVRFAPDRVVHREITRSGPNLRYAFTLLCLTSACAGAPGTETELRLPPLRIRLPSGKTLGAYWPPLREASRLAPGDLARPVPRGDVAVPEDGASSRLLGVGLATGAGLALLAAGLLGALWLAPRRLALPLPGRNGHAGLSELDYALVVARLAAGGGPDDRRAALESLAVALDQLGKTELAAQARTMAWSPAAPRGDAVRRLAATAQQVTR